MAVFKYSEYNFLYYYGKKKNPVGLEKHIIPGPAFSVQHLTFLNPGSAVVGVGQRGAAEILPEDLVLQQRPTTISTSSPSSSYLQHL